MPSTNEKLSDRSVRHLAYLSRLATHQANLLKEDLGDWRDDIMAILIPLLVELVRENSGMLTARQQNKLLRLRLQINQANTRLTGEIYDKMKARLEDIIKNEADFVSRLYKELTDHDINDPEGVEEIAALTIAGKTLKQYMQELGANTTTKLNNAIKQGLLDEKNTDEILDEIGDDKDGVWAGRLAVAGAIGETGVYLSSESARYGLFDANRDIIKGWWYSIILDSKTCLRCISKYDDNPYEIDNRPRSVTHPRCRCSVYPLVEGGGALPDKDYETWLQGQPKSVQEEVLGKRKRQLWQSGEYDVSEFTVGDRILTLDELKGLDSQI